MFSNALTAGVQSIPLRNYESVFTTRNANAGFTFTTATMPLALNAIRLMPLWFNNVIDTRTNEPITLIPDSNSYEDGVI